MTRNSNELSSGKVQLDYYRQSWNLQEDGDAFSTNSSLLQPVLYEGIPAMLKIPIAEEERRASFLMVHWAGNGAVRVLQHSRDALLMERASGQRSLGKMVLDGADDEASRIICGVVAKLHEAVVLPTLALIPLPEWFKSLFFAGDQLGGVFSQCAEIARFLLKDPIDEVVLHGDIHHGNILDGGDLGWLAIDPKALYGERGFDYANLFCNPEMTIAIQQGRLAQQVKVVSKAANLDPKRLLQWIIAWSGLSASWMLEDAMRIDQKLMLLEIALSELDGC
ncbi:hypothetical protein OQX61_20920 [Pedobacter sp. PLR]|uniref:aminoglycoside phosphotransferase family protein n=1 Tax=Pedobacter sp. PLR TaxID=2994465 RepID=UPI00224835B7|nr:aminoglycoside phosphotransferase family protein [Pedobacter sp. PLR]MCX2453746.1 hypothetical protein [Pedobacter sp. PLR]